MSRITTTQQRFKMVFNKNTMNALVAGGISGPIIGNMVNQTDSVLGLHDVNLTTRPPIAGATLVYNSNTSMFDVEVLNIDGGTF